MASWLEDELSRAVGEEQWTERDELNRFLTMASRHRSCGTMSVAVFTAVRNGLCSRAAVRHQHRERKMQKAAWIVCAVLVLSGCTSTGTLGLVTKSGADSGAVLREARPYREVGPARGSSCR